MIQNATGARILLKHDGVLSVRGDFTNYNIIIFRYGPSTWQMTGRATVDSALLYFRLWKHFEMAGNTSA